MTADLSPGVARVPGVGERPRIRLTGPGALAACLPQFVGFNPVESLVLVGLSPLPNGRHEIGMTVRVDLTEVGRALSYRADDEDALWERAAEDPEDRETEEQLRSLLRFRAAIPCHPEAIAAVLVRNGCVAAQVVAVSELARPPTGSDLEDLDDVAGRPVFETYLALQAHGVKVVDAILVHAGRWWSYLCHDPTCCPPQGTPVSSADADLLRAERSWAGDPDHTLTDRADIVARVAPRPGPETEAVAALLADPGRGEPPEAASSLELVAAMIARWQTPAPTMSDEEWAQLLAGLGRIQVRDASLSVWKGAAGSAALELWCAATRIAPPGYVAAPATLAGMVAHARGEGALAGAALDRALDDDPGYRLANYAMTALTSGLPPKQIRQMIIGSTATMRARGEPVLDSRGRVSGERASTRRRRRGS